MAVAHILCNKIALNTGFVIVENRFRFFKRQNLWFLPNVKKNVIKFCFSVVRYVSVLKVQIVFCVLFTVSTQQKNNYNNFERYNGSQEISMKNKMMRLVWDSWKLYTIFSVQALCNLPNTLTSLVRAYVCQLQTYEKCEN